MSQLRFDFAGKHVLVVGASRGGIGSAIAAAFHTAGARVTITGAEDAPVEALAQIPYHRLDVTDLAAVDALAAAMLELDILVNCAAITARGEEMAPDFFAKVLDVNLQGSFRTATRFQPQLAAADGVLINIASMYAQFGSPRNPAYGASKAAVVQLTKSLAIAWAPDGIRVNAIAPGFVVTEQSARARQDPAFVEGIEARTPLGRWGTPDDMVGAVLFLASDAARYITGTCLAVDGGYSVV